MAKAAPGGISMEQDMACLDAAACSIVHTLTAHCPTNEADAGFKPSVPRDAAHVSAISEPQSSTMPRLLAALLLVACSTCTIAQQQAKKPPPATKVLSLHGLKKAISHFWDGKKGLMCADCIQLAMEIGHMLYKPPDVDSDDLNIAAPGPGRRMKFPNKEREIYDALDVACGMLGESRNWGDDVLQDCQRLVVEHRRALENSIFDRGTEALASTMCVEQFKLCSPHHLMDSGEL